MNDAELITEIERRLTSCIEVNNVPHYMTSKTPEEKVHNTLHNILYLINRHKKPEYE